MSPRETMVVIEDDHTLASEIVHVVSARVPAVAVRSAAEALHMASDGETVWLGAIVDVGLPDGNGLELVQSLRRLKPGLAVLVLTGREEPRLANRAVLAGAQFAVKPLGRDELNVFVAHAIATQPGQRIEAALVELADASGLSPREGLILRQSVLGVSREALRQELGVTENTLKTQVRSMCRRLDAPSLDAAVRRVLEHALRRP